MPIHRKSKGIKAGRLPMWRAVPAIFGKINDRSQAEAEIRSKRSVRDQSARASVGSQFLYKT